MSTIEQDAIRVNKYNQFKGNLNLLTEIFMEGDSIVKNGNELLIIIKNELDSGESTSWTKQDFNDMLIMRNSVLEPIIQNTSFAMQFERYII